MLGFGAQKNGATVLRWEALPGGGEVAADRIIFTWSLTDRLLGEGDSLNLNPLLFSLLNNNCSTIPLEDTK